MATASSTAWTAGFTDGLPLSRRALAYAFERHAGQRREDGTPFALHPVEAAQLLATHGHPDHVVAAALLHDVLEDTGAGANELRERFGDRVAELVLAVSDCGSEGSYPERKAALRESVERAGPEAAAVFAADKVSKVRELRPVLVEASGDDAQLARKLAHYRASLDVVERVLGVGDPLARDLRFELEALRLVAPGVA